MSRRSRRIVSSDTPNSLAKGAANPAIATQPFQNKALPLLQHQLGHKQVSIQIMHKSE